MASRVSRITAASSDTLHLSCSVCGLRRVQRYPLLHDVRNLETLRICQDADCLSRDAELTESSLDRVPSADERRRSVMRPSTCALALSWERTSLLARPKQKGKRKGIQHEMMKNRRAD